MKRKYYANNNPQNDGTHEVHNEDCVYLKDIVDKKYLGELNNCKDAVNKAKQIYKKVDGCKVCSPECHTR